MRIMEERKAAREAAEEALVKNDEERTTISGNRTLAINDCRHCRKVSRPIAEVDDEHTREKTRLLSKNLKARS